MKTALLKRWLRAGGISDSTAPSGYAIVFTADSYTEGTDDSSVSLDVTGAEVGATWALTISSSGGGTNVTDNGTVSTASFTISGKDLTALNPGTLTASLVLTDTAANEGSPATDTATLSAAGYTFTNAEAEAYVAEFDVEPSDGWKEAIDIVLVGGLKTAGLYAKADYFRVGANVDSQAATLDLIDPTRAATLVNSPTFTAKSGFAGNGTTSYVSEAFTPSTDVVNASQNSLCYGLYIDGGTDSASTGKVTGCEGSGGVTLAIYPWYQNTGSAEVGGLINCGADSRAGNVATAYGLTTINRSGASAVQIYRNGSSLGSDTDTSTGLPNRSLATGSYNDGTPGAFHNYRYGLVCIFSSLNSTEQAALDTVWDAWIAEIATL